MSATASKSASGGSVSLQCTDVLMEELPKTGESVEIDLGLKNFAVTSDG